MYGKINPNAQNRSNRNSGKKINATDNFVILFQQERA